MTPLTKGTAFKTVLAAQALAIATVAHNSGPEAAARALEAAPQPTPPSLTIPMRLSANENSPYYDAQVALRLGIEFEGAKRRGDVREYCIEDPETGRGWVEIEARLPNGKPRIERGRYITVRKYGVIRPYWK